MKKIESPSKQELIDAFQNCFLALTEPEVKKCCPRVKKFIKKYADLMLNLEKIEVLNATIPEMRDSGLVSSTLNALEKSKKIWLE